MKATEKALGEAIRRVDDKTSQSLDEETKMRAEAPCS